MKGSYTWSVLEKDEDSKPTLQAQNVISKHYHVWGGSFIHSFPSAPFLWGELRGQQPQEGSKYLKIFQQFQIVLLAPHQDVAPHQDGTKQGWRCSHSTWSLDDSGPLSRGCSQQDLPRQSSLGHLGTWWNHSSSLSEEVAWHSGLDEFHSCALCREVSRRGLFVKTSSLPLALGIIFFQSFPDIHDHRWESEERPI